MAFKNKIPLYEFLELKVNQPQICQLLKMLIVVVHQSREKYKINPNFKTQT